MKIERLLLGLFTSFLMVGCSQNDDLPNGGEEQGIDESYISINIVSKTNASRATDADFQVGDENAVTSAYFFFFNNDGSPYMLKNNVAEYQIYNTTTTVQGAATNNWLYFSDFTSVPAEELQSGGFEKKLNAILVFDGVSTGLPDEMVVVLNGPADLMAGVSSGIFLAALAPMLITEAAAIPASGKSFMMSNSVYQADNEILQSTNIGAFVKENASMANNAPADVYVERLAAKVSVAELDGSKLEGEQSLRDNAQLPKALKVNGLYVNGQTPQDVYVNILGWDLNTTVDKSYLIKKLTANATYTGFDTNNPWNDPAYKRSYWAETPSSDVSYDKSFTWAGITNNLGTGVDYCLENTSSTTTKIVVKAQLEDVNGNPLTIAQWLTEYYVPAPKTQGVAPTWDGDHSLFAAIVNTLNLYYQDNNGWAKIHPSHLKMVPMYENASGVASTDASDYYKVKFALSDEVIANTSFVWRQANSAQEAAGLTESDNKTSEQVNSIIQGVKEAKVWQKGAAYYFTALHHLNGVDATVRNHHYQVSITGVKGLGTPVYYPDGYQPDDTKLPVIPEPVDPEDDEVYLSARINVLSWRLVNNEVVLGKR